MKKLILITLVLSSIGMFGQDTIHYKYYKLMLMGDNSQDSVMSIQIQTKFKKYNEITEQLLELYNKYCEEIKTKIDTIWMPYDTGLFLNGDEENVIYSNTYYLRKRKPNGLDHNFMEWLKNKYK